MRYRAKLVGMRSGFKAQTHAVLAKQGPAVPMTDLFGVGGRQRLAHLCADAPGSTPPTGSASNQRERMRRIELPYSAWEADRAID